MKAAQLICLSGQWRFYAVCAGYGPGGAGVCPDAVMGVWEIRMAYSGWAENRLSSRQFMSVLGRVAVMYVVLSFFLLS